MSRSQPYRTKMPVEIIRALDVASRITLFMVGQSGPLSFTFKDRLDHKYKTSIGADLKCTCSPNRHDHCIHTLYIMLKIFKISPQNPIMWQAAYVDSQLSDLLSGKYTVITNRSRVVRPVFQESEENNELPSDFLERRIRQRQISKYNSLPELKAERMQLTEESVCPICQQIMSQDMCLTYCKVKCGNNFHAQCIKVWAEHKKTTQTEITCPMCRGTLGNIFLRQIQIMQRQYKKAQLDKIKLKYKCSGCGVNEIPKNVYKCILCKSFQLCQVCYSSNKHLKHPFIKQDPQDGRWRGAEERRQAELKMKNFIDTRRKEKNMNEKLIEKLRKVQEDPKKLLDYVASAYPYVSKYISDNIDPYKKLDFNPDQMRCMKCNAKKMVFLRRLTCGHFIDHECLKDNILKNRFHCDECGTKILKGYENLVELQKDIENKKQKQGIRLEVNDEFNPSKMQENQSRRINEQQDYNFVLPEEATLADILGQVRETYIEQPQPYRLRNRISNNLVRMHEPQQYQYHPHQQYRTSRMLSNHTPHQTARKKQKKRETVYQTNQNNNNIRIRNVGKSVGMNQPNRSGHRSSRKDILRQKQELGLMIEAMVGRKIN